MRVLLIDNNILPEYWGAQDIARYQSLVPGSLFTVRRAPQNDLPRSLTHFDKVIVSGSLTSILDDAPWIDSLEILIRTALNESKPTLGICYGHQMLARTLFGKDSIGKAPQSEYGWTSIQKKEDSILFKNISNQFYSFSSHNDEVRWLPETCAILAQSDRCKIQAFQVRNQPAFGIQFHPEKHPIEAQKTFLERKKKGLGKDYLNPHRDFDLYDPKIAETIFTNFLSL